MRKSTEILEEIKENKELLTAEGLMADEKQFMEDEIKSLDDELKLALENEKSKPTTAPLKKDASIIKAPATKKEKTTSVVKAPVKKEKEKTFVMDGDKKIFEDDINYCHTIIKLWAERKEARKKSAGKRKTKPVTQRVAADIASAVSKGIGSITNTEIKKDPKAAIKKMERLEKAGKEFLEAYKDILGDNITQSEIKAEFEGLDKAIKEIEKKYVTKMGKGGSTDKPQTYYLALKKADTNWDENPQEEFYGTWKKAINEAKKIAKENNKTVRMSSSKGYSNQGTYIDNQFKNGGSTDKQTHSYKLTTGNGVNEMKIHSTRTDNLEFNSFLDARKAFKKEVIQLKKEYINQKSVDYSIDSVKESEQIRTRVDKITFDEDGGIKDIETILESDSFIM